MHTYIVRPLRYSTLAPAILGMLLVLITGIVRPDAAVSLAPGDPARYIVQAENSTAAAAAVEQAGGNITHELRIINAVAAELDHPALAQLRADPRLALHADALMYASDDDRETDTSGYDLYPSAAVKVHSLHERQISSPRITCANKQISVSNSFARQQLQGGGITVAIVDSGLLPMASPGDWKHHDQQTGTLIAENSGRCIIYRNFANYGHTKNSIDGHGHGTHVAATIADNRETELAPGMNATPVGVAPQTNLVIARALGDDGSGSYADVIAAIEWIVANKDTYAIRVLNLSLYAPVSDFYWKDPLNQAVMRAWQAGIVVVTVAGNDGPLAGTITAPGNIPYVITVGALTSGRYTSSGLDELADYSSRGPTESAFVKPDLVVPATRTIAPMPNQSYLAEQIGPQGIISSENVDLQIGSPDEDHAYYELSGTSMAAAQVSGIVALMLQANPNLSPDQVKYRLLATARPAMAEMSGEPVYTVWEQGAGLVDAEQAVFASTSNAANAGLDIQLDLDPGSSDHHWGFTTWDEQNDTFRLIDPDTGEAIEVWEGGRRSSAGNNWLWTSGRRSSAGSSETWAGGRRSSAGSTLAWAGNDMPWMQSGLQMLPGGPVGKLVLEHTLPRGVADETRQARFTIWLPLVGR